MTDRTRREFFGNVLDCTLTGAVLAAVTPNVAEAVANAADSSESSTGDDSPVRIIVPDSYEPKTSEADRERLATATLDYLTDYWGNDDLPLWGKPLEDIDMETRLRWITHWVMKGVEDCKDIYPVDPAWIMAQMKEESYFCEFAVSPALAVGVAQFIPTTAEEYGMTVAGSNSTGNLKLDNLKGSADDYYQLREDKRKFNTTDRPQNTGLLNGKGKVDETALNAIIDKIESADPAQVQRLLSDAQDVKAFIDAKKVYDRRISEAAKNYMKFVRANLKGRDIFDDDDATFLGGFDERTLYRKPIPAMVRFIAKNLKARNGNILTAAAGYNAGLGNTKANGPYEPFGRIPGFEETANYVSRIVVSHYAINRRIEALS